MKPCLPIWALPFPFTRKFCNKDDILDPFISPIPSVQQLLRASQSTCITYWHAILCINCFSDLVSLIILLPAMPMPTKAHNPHTSLKQIQKHPDIPETRLEFDFLLFTVKTNRILQKFSNQYPVWEKWWKLQSLGKAHHKFLWPPYLHTKYYETWFWSLCLQMDKHGYNASFTSSLTLEHNVSRETVVAHYDTVHNDTVHLSTLCMCRWHNQQQEINIDQSDKP